MPADASPLRAPAPTNLSLHLVRSRPVLLSLLLIATALFAITQFGIGAQQVSAATPLKQVEVGLSHACALDTSGRIVCWGDDSAGQVSDWGRWRYQSERFNSVSAGSFFTCGVKTNGSLMCWGYPERENGSHAEATNEDWTTWTARTTQTGYTGWVNTPPEAVKFKPESLSIGNFHACAIQTNGQLSCWGKAGDDRLVIPTNQDGSAITDWTFVEAGFANACGIRQGGSVVCFGRQTFDRSAGPSGAGPFIDVTVGVYNGCALDADGSVECWGSTGIAVLDPLKAPPTDVEFAEIEMATEQSYFYACGLDRDGEAHCWGVAGAAQQTALSGSWAMLSVGGNNSCVLDAAGYMGCWGASDGGLFSPPSGQFKQTDGGSDFSCAIKQDDTIICWGGAGAHGQIHPTEVPTGSFKQLAVGHIHACAIKQDDTVACWGGLYFDTSQVLQRIPAALDTPTGTFRAISAGPDLTCGIVQANDATDGTLHCWGETTHNRQDEPSGSYTHVAVAAEHVCAIKSDQSVACWGRAHFFDREGDGNPDDIHGQGNHTTTTPPSGSHQYTDISAGEGHTCALRTDKKAICWGYHADDRQAIPGSAGSADGFGVHNYIDIATGGLPNCAIRESDGSLACWNNEKSQYLPGPSVRAMTGFKSLGSGAYHMCGINRSDGLTCWGAGTVIPFPAQFAPPPPSRPEAETAPIPHLTYCDVWSDVALCVGPGNTETPLPFTVTVTQIVNGAFHKCALTVGGGIKCWGDDSRGQISELPKEPIYTQLGAGWWFTCGLDREEAIHCGGYNGTRQTNGPPADSGPYVQITLGNDFGCALDSFGAAHCWGNHRFGQLKVPEGVRFSQIAAGGYHVCGITTTSEVICWGGEAQAFASIGFLDVPADAQFVRLAALRYQTCGRTTTGEIVCWGEGRFNEEHYPASLDQELEPPPESAEPEGEREPAA